MSSATVADGRVAAVDPQPSRNRPTILKFVRRGSNSLQGYADVQLPSGLILHDVQIHVRGANAWVMPSSKPMLDRDSNVLRDDGNKIRWLNQILFVDKETRTRFSDAVIEAMRLAYPDALAATL